MMSQYEYFPRMCCLGTEQNYLLFFIAHLIIIFQTQFMFEQFLQQKSQCGGQMK